MFRLGIPHKLNHNNYLVPDWNCWHVRFRLWLYWNVFDKYIPYKDGSTFLERVTFWLYLRNFILDGEAESCWVGGYELGPDD